MTWNYRIVRYRDVDPEADHCVAVHEVYYKEDGVTPTTWSAEAVRVSAWNLEDLRWRMEEWLKAFEKPVLEIEKDENSSDSDRSAEAPEPSPELSDRDHNTA